MRIDAHQHFWRYDPAEYPWMRDDWKIRRDYLPADLLPNLTACQLDGSIAVQARQSLTETRWLLELAEQTPEIVGVVGWVDLCAENVEPQLEEFVDHPKFVGVRHVLQDEPDDFILCDAFKRGIATLSRYDLTYDLLVYSRQLPLAIALADAFPEQPFVLDHLAKPNIAEGKQLPWKRYIESLARRPNVMCKLSGLVTEAKWNECTIVDCQPYLDAALKAFGNKRLMFGSDWPVALLAGSYEHVFALIDTFAADFSAAEREALFGQNAADFYFGSHQ